MIGEAGQKQLVEAKSEGEKGLAAFFEKEKALAKDVLGPGGMPPLPSGKSTILGGAIRDVDPVLDRFTLRIVGEKPIKILFDERTQIFQDGKKVPLRDLKPADHASVQTILDGTNVFALSVHVLSKSPEGDYQGHRPGR